MALPWVPLAVVPWIATALRAGDVSVVDFVSVSGWLIVVWGIRLLFTGRLITGREADERDERYQQKVAECTQLRETVAGFVEAIGTSNAMIEAVMAEARRQDDQRAPAPPRRRPAARDSTGGQGGT